jgi:hypothetical protein
MIIESIRTNVLSLESFFTHIDREFFTPNVGELEYLSVFNGNGFKWTVLVAYFAFVLAAALIYYNRTVIGAFPRALVKGECFSQESAKTLDELGFSRNIFVKLSLIFGTTLRRVVRCVEAEEWQEARKDVKGSKVAEFLLPEKRYKNNFSTDKFYIPESYKYTAEIRFAKKGNGLLSLVLTAVLGIVAVVLIFKFAPSLLSMIDEFIGSIAAK